MGRAKYRTFEDIKDRVWAKLDNWKNSHISQAGKEILLKSVVQVIPTYAMSFFQLPKKLCNNIESAMARFWWNYGKKEKKYSSEEMGKNWCSKI